MTLLRRTTKRNVFLNSWRVAVMNGIIEQSRYPEEIYQHPTTEFVARFIDLKTIKGMVKTKFSSIVEWTCLFETLEHAKEGDVTVTIRPDLELLNEGDGEIFQAKF